VAVKICSYSPIITKPHVPQIITLSYDYVAGFNIILFICLKFENIKSEEKYNQSHGCKVQYWDQLEIFCCFSLISDPPPPTPPGPLLRTQSLFRMSVPPQQ
jgi:hypothetical protein